MKALVYHGPGKKTWEDAPKPGVSNFKEGDHVIISCITSCGTCDACKKGMYSHCADGGWILGHLEVDPFLRTSESCG